MFNMYTFKNRSRNAGDIEDEVSIAVFWSMSKKSSKDS